MIRKAIHIIVALSFFLFPMYLYGDELTGKITTVSKDQKAPFDGALIDSTAMAKILSDKEISKKKCELDNNYLTMRKSAECELSMGNAKITIEVLEKKLQITTTLKDDEIKKLNEIIIKESDNKNAKYWWLGGGILVGVALTVATILAVSYAQK